MERWRDWRMTDVRAGVWSLSRMLSVPEGVVSLQTTAGFTQKKTCCGERDQTFTTEYLWSWSAQISRHIFLRFSEGGGGGGGGFVRGDPHTLTGERTPLFTHTHVLLCGEKRNKSQGSLEWKVVNVVKSERSRSRFRKQTYAHTERDPMLENAVVELWSTVVMRLHLKPMKPLWQLMKARLVSPPLMPLGVCVAVDLCVCVLYQLDREGYK